jgi:hypothetical protein
MVDIATVSVVSSSLVALGTIAANFIGGERQRSHETDLDFERRVWEEKSKALFAVIRDCRAVIDSDDPLTDDSRKSWALYLSKRLDAFTDVQATIEAFASTECRTALTDLIDALRSAGVKDYLGNRVKRYEDLMAKVPLSPPSDTQSTLAEVKQRQKYRQWIEETEQAAVTDFNPDLPDLQARAQRLLEAARGSVRRPKD